MSNEINVDQLEAFVMAMRSVSTHSFAEPGILSEDGI
jgi:hypothetical protein